MELFNHTFVMPAGASDYSYNAKGGHDGRPFSIRYSDS
jgi:hypothetical protein